MPRPASVSLHWRSFYGRGWITQAAHLKKPRRGFFPRRTVRRVDAVRIHPPSLREGYYKTETPVPGSDTGVLGGRGWIRTTEAEKQQIYSLSPLATREHAQILFTSVAGRLVYFSRQKRICQPFFRIFSASFFDRKKTAQLGGNPPLRLRRFANDSWSGASPLLSVPDASGAHSPGEPQWPRRKADRAR